MLFSDNLFISKNIENPHIIINKLRNNEGSAGVYLVCTNSKSCNLLEIFHCLEILKPYHDQDSFKVIALCHNKEEAKEKCASIIAKFLAEHGSLYSFKDLTNGSSELTKK